MKSSLNNTCISAVLCGAVLVALPALAAGAGGGVGAGAATGAAGTSIGTGVNTTGQATTPAGTLNQPGPALHATLNAADKVGGSVSTGGMTSSGDLNSATAGNNAGSVNTQAQTPASGRAWRARRGTTPMPPPVRH